VRSIIGAVVGGLVGLAAGSLLYVVLVPVLEESSGLVRELQGPLWNVVPFLTLAGIALGWWLSRRSRRER
jgi:H+/Cl- antiporter ClcA